jgi:predicted enzyme related to lactoylglutathione lyase|tara:strand:- start:176 stop:667 length:492 start_codon:yes stop_codon:yes gene_type:complete
MKKYLIILSSLLFFSCENLSKTKGIDMTENKPKVVGVGGVFFKSENPEETKKWYEENLGLPTDQYGTMFKSRDIDNPDEITYLQWSPFNKDTDYFDPSKKEFMINYRVQNIEDFVKILKEKGITVLDEITEYGEIGKFVHILDPEGNKIELWEPPKSTVEDKK